MILNKLKFTNKTTKTIADQESFVSRALSGVITKIDDPLGKKRGTLGQVINLPAITANNNNATIFVILIIGFTAGPAVSLYGSPTVSPVTAAL